MKYSSRKREWLNVWFNARGTSLNAADSCSWSLPRTGSLLSAGKGGRGERDGRSALYHRRHRVILLERTRYALFWLARQHSAPHKYLWIIVGALRCSAAARTHRRKRGYAGRDLMLPQRSACLSRNARRNMAPLPRNRLPRYVNFINPTCCTTRGDLSSYQKRSTLSISSQWEFLKAAWSWRRWANLEDFLHPLINLQLNSWEERRELESRFSFFY